MIYLLKNIDCFCPKYAGKKDILIAGGKIDRIAEPNSIKSSIVNVISGDGLAAFPGLVDGHAHITGGGGENGFASRLPELSRDEILRAGVTTVVGLLGADGQTRSLKELLAKAKALECQGITTFIYSGSYAVPIITLTGDLTGDMVLVDKVVGAGEVAISDHRSSHPGAGELVSLASKARLGGLLSGKAGLVHVHVGDGKDGLGLIRRALEASDLPTEQFLPTHVNRNPGLFRQAVYYAKAGGNIDLTSGEVNGVPAPDAVRILMDHGVDTRRVTVSSDAGGSTPAGDAGTMDSLYADVVGGIREKNISPEIMFSLATQNAARRIGQYPRKGALSGGGDADILIVNKNYEKVKIFSMGQLLFDDGKILEDATHAR